jgi:hypothetical protein
MDFNPLQRERDAFRVLVGVVALFALAMVVALAIQAL